MVVKVLLVAGLLALSANVGKQSAVLPGTSGQTLGVAWDTARRAGCSTVTTHDASGEGRVQVLTRNWQVPATTPVDRTVVKSDERRP